jgi:succinyl-CoA synthetase alpha subunit
MSILANRNTRLLVQGMTGREGSFHTQQMLKYGSQIMGGISPGKGGEWVHGVPVFDSVRKAIDATEANASIIFVPAATAPDAIYEAIDAELELIVCITEGIPILEMAKIYSYLQGAPSRLIGPNCPGVLVPGQTNIGIMPGYIASPGNVGVVSKSGTLTYEVLYTLTQAGIGQSACVGIGGDPIIGTNFIDVLTLFEEDPETERVVLIGEIGDRAEIDAAEFIKASMTKPVAAFIAGRSAPAGVRMGHAGAIIEGGEGTAGEKIDALLAAGVRVADNPEQIVALLG